VPGLSSRHSFGRSFRITLGHAGALRMRAALSDPLRVYVHAHAPRSELLHRRDHDPTVAATQIVNDVARTDSRKLEHFGHDCVRRRFVSNVRRAKRLLPGRGRFTAAARRRDCNRADENRQPALRPHATTMPSPTNIAAAAAAPRARSLVGTTVVMRLSYTTTMRFRDKFRLFAVLRVAAGGLLPALMLALVLAGTAVSPLAAASAMLSVSSATYAGAVHGEPPLSVPISMPRVTDGPARCFERHHPCGPGANAAACAEPFSLGPTRRTSVVTPRAPAPVPVSGVAPHRPASLSILFRNFRE